MTYSETIAWLFEQFPAYHQLGAQAYNPGLKNTEELCAFFGNPHQSLRFVHVGGTNGKGSVSNMTASVLMEAGEKVGLFTSPHLFDFTERIRINGKPIEEQFVIDFCEKVRNHSWTIQPSFFEITWVMALAYFQQHTCSIVVAEVGLGGRLDATNIIDSLVTVITNIGLDHTNILGDTRAKIAFEKAGIIKRHTPVILGEMDSETFPIFVEVAKKQEAPIVFPDHEVSIPDEVIGYQRGNFRIVLRVCEVLTEYVKIDEQTIHRGITNLKANTGFFGRMEVISTSPLTIADCAHNAHGIRALFESVGEITTGTLHCVYGTSSDKNLEEIIPLLPENARYYFTPFANPRSMSLEELKQKLTGTKKNALFFESPLEALKNAQNTANKTDTILIFGSFFLIHDFFDFFSKKVLQKRNNALYLHSHLRHNGGSEKQNKSGD